MRGGETEGNIKRPRGVTVRKQGRAFLTFFQHLKTFILFPFTLCLKLAIPLPFRFFPRGDFLFKPNMNAERMRERDVLYF